MSSNAISKIPPSPYISSHYPIPEDDTPSNAIHSCLCFGCCIDIGSGLTDSALAKLNDDKEKETDAYIKIVRAPFACGKGGGNVVKVPDLVFVATQVATTVRFAIDKTPLSAVAKAGTFFGYGFCIIETIITSINMFRVFDLRSKFNFSEINDIHVSNETLIKNLNALKQNYYDLTPAEQEKIDNEISDEAKQSLERSFHQKHYREFATRVRPHIALEVFGEENNTFSDQKMCRLKHELGQSENRQLAQYARMEAIELLQLIDVQTKKALILQLLTLISLILTIVGLSLGFAAYSPIAIIFLMNTATALSIVEGLLSYCLLENRGWSFKLGNLVPNCLKTLISKVHSCASSCFSYFRRGHSELPSNAQIQYTHLPSHT